MLLDVRLPLVCQRHFTFFHIFDVERTCQRLIGNVYAAERHLPAARGHFSDIYYRASGTFNSCHYRADAYQKPAADIFKTPRGFILMPPYYQALRFHAYSPSFISLSCLDIHFPYFPLYRWRQLRLLDIDARFRNFIHINNIGYSISAIFLQNFIYHNE